MEQIYGFNLFEKKPLTINPLTAKPGKLELYCLSEGAELFLFRGTLNSEECINSINEERSAFAAACNSNTPGYALWDGGQTQFTVISLKSIHGYVRIYDL